MHDTYHIISYHHHHTYTKQGEVLSIYNTIGHPDTSSCTWKYRQTGKLGLCCCVNAIVSHPYTCTYVYKSPKVL